MIAGASEDQKRDWRRDSDRRGWVEIITGDFLGDLTLLRVGKLYPWSPWPETSK